MSFSYSGFGETALLGLTAASAAGELLLSEKTEALRFRFEPPVTIGDGVSLEAEYSFRAEGDAALPERCRVIADFGGGSAWEFPRDAAFLFGGAAAPAGALTYAVPLNSGVISEFSISVSAVLDAFAPSAKGSGAWTLHSLKFVPRWYGVQLSGSGGGRSRLKFTPFLTRDDGASLVISPPAEYGFRDAPELSLEGVKGGAYITAGRTHFEYRPVRGSLAAQGELLLPAGAFAGPVFPLTLSGADSGSGFSLTSFIVAPGQSSPFPAPIPADPGLILSYPMENWRTPDCEVFRWPAFPEILIVDTADYAVQERFFKRLAFFVEKRDYRGRLVPDGELEGLHGWNAHDYRAEDLALFFEAARLSAFPLLDEERTLCSLLLDDGILLRQPDGKIVPGTGAVLSISKESSDSLRRRFMAHECFHGLFFIDGDFRNFSAGRWENFSPEARRFFISYLGFLRYDTVVSYLTVNEFMAYCLQQTSAQAPHYFGEYLPGQIAANPLRRDSLPAEEQETDDGRRLWPGLARAFAREAEAFSDYVLRRWGFSAGMIFSVTSNE